MLKILIVDDNKKIRDSFKKYFLKIGYDSFTAKNTVTALEVAELEEPQIMIIDFDLPGINGIELIKKIKNIDDSVKFILISGKLQKRQIADDAEKLGVIEFIPKPVSLRYIREHVFAKIQEVQFICERNIRKRLVNIEIKSLQLAMNALESKDKYTNGHSKRVKDYCLNTVQYLPDKLKENINKKDLMRAGLLHDIGKIGIVDNILMKSGPLTKNEYQKIQNHPFESVKILEPFKDEMLSCIKAIKHHHERFDGTGYPDNLKGDKIPIMARILTVTDAFDAMTSDRAYRRRWSSAEAVNELNKYKKIQFDPIIVDAFVKFIEYQSVPYAA